MVNALYVNVTSKSKLHIVCETYYEATRGNQVMGKDGQFTIDHDGSGSKMTIITLGSGTSTYLTSFKIKNITINGVQNAVNLPYSWDLDGVSKTGNPISVSKSNNKLSLNLNIKSNLNTNFTFKVQPANCGASLKYTIKDSNGTSATNYTGSTKSSVTVSVAPSKVGNTWANSASVLLTAVDTEATADTNAYKLESWTIQDVGTKQLDGGVGYQYQTKSYNLDAGSTKTFVANFKSVIPKFNFIVASSKYEMQNYVSGTAYNVVAGTKVTASASDSPQYTLDYWKLSSRTDKPTSNPLEYKMPSANVTATAYWKEREYTVSFDGEKSTGKYNDSYTIPSRIDKTGQDEIFITYSTGVSSLDKKVKHEVDYVRPFTGWSPNPTGKFTKNETFTSQYGSKNYTPIQIDPALDYGSDPIRRGYIFQSWTPGSISTTESKTETANWTVKSYTVYFQLDDSTGYTSSKATWADGTTGNKSITKVYTDQTRSISDVPIRYGYNFKGWTPIQPSKGDKEATAKALIGANEVIRTDGAFYSDSNPDSIILYSVWEPKKFNVECRYFNWINNNTIDKTEKVDKYTLTIEQNGIWQKINPNNSDTSDWATIGWTTVKPPASSNGRDWGKGDETTSGKSWRENYGCFSIWGDKSKKDYTDKVLNREPEIPYSINAQSEIDWNGKAKQHYNWLGDDKVSLTIYALKNITGKFICTGIDSKGNRVWSKVGTMYVKTEQGWKIVTVPFVNTGTTWRNEIGHKE